MTSIAQSPARPLTSSEGAGYLKRFNIILNIRSITLLLFVAYLFSGPVPHETDIVATVVACSLVCLITLLFLVTLLSSLALRNRFDLQVFPPIDQAAGDHHSGIPDIIPNRPARFVFKTSPLKIFPGFVLRIRCDFVSSDMKPMVFHIYGQSSEPRLIVQDMTFPYRGLWKLASVHLEYGDRLELTHYEWELPPEALDQIIRVSVRTDFDSSLPIICSASRPGDLMQDVQRRQGDPFDLKPYHPADGMRKILWKIYAKSGELISRHPEPSMTPEGEVVVFVIANKRDDHVCSASLAYVRLLEQLDLQIFLSCEGASTLDIAESSDEAQDLFVESVWNTRNTSVKSIQNDVQELLQRYASMRGSISLQRILIFCSEERLGSELGCELAATAAHHIEEKGIKPVFCVARDIYGVNPLDDGAHERYGKISELLIRAAFTPEPEVRKPNRQLYSKFMMTCANNDWQVFT